jgi:hypothetical protein
MPLLYRKLYKKSIGVGANTILIAGPWFPIYFPRKIEDLKIELFAKITLFEDDFLSHFL